MQRDIQSASDLVLAMLSYRLREKKQQLDIAIDNGTRNDIRIALRELAQARKAYREFTNPSTNDSTNSVDAIPAA